MRFFFPDSHCVAYIAYVWLYHVLYPHYILVVESAFLLGKAPLDHDVLKLNPQKNMLNHHWIQLHKPAYNPIVSTLNLKSPLSIIESQFNLIKSPLYKSYQITIKSY